MAVSEDGIKRARLMFSEPALQVISAKLTRGVAVSPIPTKVVIPGIEISANPPLQITVECASGLIPVAAQTGEGAVDSYTCSSRFRWTFFRVWRVKRCPAQGAVG